QAFDAVADAGAVGPAVAVHPKAQLKVHTAGDGLLADEAEHLQIAIPFLVRKIGGPDVGPRHRKQEWIKKEEVGVGDLLEGIVTETKGQVEAVEPLHRQHV